MSDLGLPTIHYSEVRIGNLVLTAETMTLKRQQVLAQTIADMDLSALVGALAPIIAATNSSTAFSDAISKNFDGLRQAFAGALGGDKISECVAVMLDTEKNYDRLKAEFSEIGPAKRGKFNLFLGSEDVREWIKLVITPEQALVAARAVIRLSSYGAMGKALLGDFMAGMSAAQESAPMPTDEPQEAPVEVEQEENGAAPTPM
jgi:hypothetical protein